MNDFNTYIILNLPYQTKTLLSRVALGRTTTNIHGLHASCDFKGTYNSYNLGCSQKLQLLRIQQYQKKRSEKIIFEKTSHTIYLVLGLHIWGIPLRKSSL